MQCQDGGVILIRLNTAQRLALNLDSHIVIDAGAGTGKTSTIVDRVIEHYLATDQRATRLLPKPARPSSTGGGMVTAPASVAAATASATAAVPAAKARAALLHSLILSASITCQDPTQPCPFRLPRSLPGVWRDIRNRHPARPTHWHAPGAPPSRAWRARAARHAARERLTAR